MIAWSRGNSLSSSREAASTHRIRIFVQARLHGIDNVLVLPPPDAALRSLRALSLQRAGAARVGPVAVQKAGR
jgi:hypothetical protein